MKPPARRALLTAALAATAATAGAQTNPGMTPAAPPANPGTGLSGLTARANAGTVGVVSGGVDGTYVRIAADLAAVLDGPELRVLPIIGKGSLQNIEDIILLRGIDVGIVQSDTLAVARRRRRLPGIENMIQYIAKLYDEEVHVLARDDIGSMRDLAGQPVNIDLAPSGTAMTSSLIFEGLNIA
ncbi:MAG TPA: TRAP transporter substrate-binding protein, partial [Roseococcus sp.]|nr:TRAP transporter substrate-binding protein [Roseococcus sp.]